jgi:hypothetical protein
MPLLESYTCNLELAEKVYRKIVTDKIKDDEFIDHIGLTRLDIHRLLERLKAKHTYHPLQPLLIRYMKFLNIKYAIELLINEHISKLNEEQINAVQNEATSIYHSNNSASEGMLQSLLYVYSVYYGCMSRRQLFLVVYSKLKEGVVYSKLKEGVVYSKLKEVVG